MKKILAILLSVLTPLIANAYAIKHEGIVYLLNTEDYTAEVYEAQELYSTETTIPEVVTDENGTSYTVVGISSEAFNYHEKLTTINLPNTLKYIGKKAFACCRKLTSVVIPDGVTSIGDGAFAGSNGAGNVVLPDAVTSIGDYAFSGSIALNSLTLGKEVRQIGHGAFAYCDDLQDFYFNTNTLPATEWDVFEESNPNMTLHVPEAMLNDFRGTAPWSDFSDIVTFDNKLKGATSINNLYLKKNTTMYNLNGQRTDRSYRGFLIMDGRKVLIR